MRRGDPARIYQAHRAGIFARPTQQERVNDLDAEHWISAWEPEAESTNRARDALYWSDAWGWIAENRRR